MRDRLNAAGVPLTHRGWLWSKILDTLAGSAAANGDMLYRSSGQWRRLPLGSSGKLLKAVGGVPVWGATGAGGGIGFAGAVYQDNPLVITNATTGNTYVDSELIIGLDTGTYYFEVQQFFLAHATPDLKAQLHFTGTASFVRYHHSTIILSNASYFNDIGDAFDVTYTFSNTANGHMTWYGTVVVTAAGDLSHQIAQITASATSITLKSGGSLLLWKLA